MKKKGLIISTVVMVVVLIAALTTTTFAWFTATSNNKVEDISLSVESNNDFRFGVSQTNQVVATPKDSNFLSGTVAWNSASTGSWDNGTSGLGFELNTGVTLKLGSAVYTGTAANTEGIDTVTGATAQLKDTNKAITNFDHELYSANGEADTVGDTVAKAVANDNETGNYLHLVLGVKAAREAAVGKKLNCTVKIDVSANTSEIGMNAALYYVYRVYAQGDVTNAPNPLFAAGGAATGVQQGEFFKTSSYQTLASNVQGTEGVLTIEVEKTSIANMTDTYQIDLYIFINGWDKDCISNATGVTSKIQISFDTAE